MELPAETGARTQLVGSLVGSVAHEFNNLLTAIMIYADLLLEAPERDPRFYTGQIKTAAARGTALAQELLALAREQRGRSGARVVNLNEMAHQLQPMLQRLVGENITVHVALARGLGNVRVHPGQLEQVLVNLAANARDAMPNGGKLTVRTGNVQADEEFAGKRGLTPGAYVMVAVTDTGSGMDAATRERVFEPFFTTKEGKGSGLGLPMVARILRQNGGNVCIESLPGRGTTLRIFLPRTDAPVEPAEEVEEPVAEESGAGSTLLLVEDEAIVRESLAEVLRRSGYRVLTAGNGEEALQVARRTRRGIDLMVSDLVLPGMDGEELAARLLKLRPHLRVLLISGYDEAERRHSAVVDAELFPKPFSHAALVQKIGEVLQQAPVMATGTH